MDTARFSNFVRPDFDPQNIKDASKGKNAIGVLAVGCNEPKDGEGVGGKVTKILVENYLRRPSLKEEALKKLTEFAHDAVCVQQAPNYPVECALGALMIQDNRFRWICTGDVRIFHFVNGQVMETNTGTSPRLGAGPQPVGSSASAASQPASASSPTTQGRALPEVLPSTEFRKGENSFLLCSGSFAHAVSEREIESALSAAETAEDWLRSLKNLYEDRSSEEPFALMTIFMPEKRERMSKKALIAIIVALVLLIAGFFVFGALRRRQEGPGGPGQQPPMQQGAPGVEPTEPPAPPEGAGEPGEKPTKPPKPTEPPAPEAPAAP